MGMARKHSHLTDQELSEFREIFNLVDLDKGGTISRDELKQLMITLGLKPTQEEVNSMVAEIDSDGNGEIDFDGVPRRLCSPHTAPLPRPHTQAIVDGAHFIIPLPSPLSRAHLTASWHAEFVTVMSKKVNTSYTPHQVKAAFKVFEKDTPEGFVSLSTLETALTTYGTRKLSLAEAQELLSNLEVDENGLINYVEFVNMSALGLGRRRHLPAGPPCGTARPRTSCTPCDTSVPWLSYAHCPVPTVTSS